MAAIEFTWDSSEVGPLKGRKLEAALLRALKLSGDGAIRSMRTAAKRGVRDRVRIRAKYLANKALPLKFPRQARKLESLVWKLNISGQSVPLGQYPRRQTKKGVSIEVQKGVRKLIPSAFIATGKNGAKGVFLRPTVKRYPMGHRVGMSVADTMRDGKIPAAVHQRGQEVFSATFNRLLPLELEKAKRAVRDVWRQPG